MAKRKMRRSGRKQKNTNSVLAVAAIVLGFTAVALAGGFNFGSEPETTTTQAEARQQCTDDLQSLVEGLLDVSCYLQILGLDGEEGDAFRAYFSYDGSKWELVSSPILFEQDSTEASYSVESYFPGSLAAEVSVLNGDATVYGPVSTSFDENAGLLEIVFLDLPGPDVIEILSEGGTTSVFEVR